MKMPETRQMMQITSLIVFTARLTLSIGVRQHRKSPTWPTTQSVTAGFLEYAESHASSVNYHKTIYANMLIDWTMNHVTGPGSANEHMWVGIILSLWHSSASLHILILNYKIRYKDKNGIFPKIIVFHTYVILGEHSIGHFCINLHWRHF